MPTAQSKGASRANGVRKMSPAFQRRLDVLMDKNSEGSLSATEQRELMAMLDEVDRQTLLNLTQLLLRKRNRATSRSRTKRSAPTKLVS